MKLTTSHSPLATSQGNGGFTLIELLVYMAIMGFIIVVAGRVFSDATGMRVRTQSMTRATEIANAVSASLKEDLGRMGAKQWKTANQTGFTVNEKVYRNLNGAGQADTSSFVLTRNANADGRHLDEIIFNAMDYNANGELLAIREIRYSVENESLRRQCRTLEGTANSNCPSGSQSDAWTGVAPVTTIAANVENFSLNPSIPGIQQSTLSESIAAANKPTSLFPSPSTPDATSFSFVSRPPDGSNVLNVSVEVNSNNVILRGFTKNSPDEKKFAQVFFTPLAGAAECYEFQFIRGETYAVEFNLPYIPETASSGSEEFCHMCVFQPGEDHIAIGLRAKNAPDAMIPGVPDFPVYPPQIPTNTSNTNVPLLRYQEFSIPMDESNATATLNACISFTFAFYSQMVSIGKLSFSNFKVYRKTNEVYHFAANADNYNPGVTSGTTILNKAAVKAFELELRINIRNEIANSRIIIPVPNNGVFALSATN